MASERDPTHIMSARAVGELGRAAGAALRWPEGRSRL
jgi:hypothetical protein